MTAENVGEKLENGRTIVAIETDYPGADTATILAVGAGQAAPWVTWRAKNVDGAWVCSSGDYEFTFADAVASFQTRAEWNVKAANA